MKLQGERMHDVNHLLDVLKTSLGLPKLAFDGDGRAEIVLPDAGSIYLARIEPQILELSFRLRGLDNPDLAMARAMLQANCLGMAVGAGRLALDPGGGRAFYCLRWNVGPMSAAEVEREFDRFGQLVAFWATEGTDLVLAEAEPDPGGPDEWTAVAAEETNDDDGPLMPPTSFPVRV